MIPKLLSLISSVILGLTASVGGLVHPSSLSVATQTPIATAAPRPAIRQLLGSIDLPRNPSWPFRGDRPLRANLVTATMSVTGMSPVEVIQALQDGKSVADLAVSSGKTAADVLAVYDETVQYIFSRAQENGSLPASLAQSRIDWYEQAARQVIDLPGLSPAYPGLHELHVVIITAAVRISGLPRASVRAELKACKSLDDILKENEHNGQDAVDATMSRLETGLNRLVSTGKLNETQRQSWDESLRAALEKMVATPGLHVAGKECAQ